MGGRGTSGDGGGGFVTRLKKRKKTISRIVGGGAKKLSYLFAFCVSSPRIFLRRGWEFYAVARRAAMFWSTLNTAEASSGLAKGPRARWSRQLRAPGGHGSGNRC